MNFFKAKIFALIGLSLFLVSCSPSISVKAENSDDAAIGFSANFSLSASSTPHLTQYICRSHLSERIFVPVSPTGRLFGCSRQAREAPLFAGR